MDIQTKHVSNANGRGGILAWANVNGKRRQNTRPYQHAESVDRNHGSAAGDLALSLGLPWQDNIIHSGGSERGHLFRWPN